jgi:hypothetical protein
MGLHSGRFEWHGQLAHMIGRETHEAKWQQSQAYCVAISARVAQSKNLARVCRSLPKLATRPSRIAPATP